MWGDESEAVAPIIWLYQIVDAQKEEVVFPELLITLRSFIQGNIVQRRTKSDGKPESTCLSWNNKSKNNNKQQGKSNSTG